MFSKSIAILSFALALFAFAGLSAAEPELTPGRRTVVVFGASWCAPCITELRQLPALAQAAAPHRMQVAWLDRAAVPGPANDAPNVEIVAPPEARRKFELMGSDARGLPFTAVLGRSGQVCASFARSLNPAAVRALLAQCGD